VKLADEIFYFKRMIREAALRHNCYATFMAKPIEGEPGSAMHVHHSIVDTTGQNIFSNDDGGESAAFLHFIGGMQRHLPSVIALLAPYVNSYRRYVRDFAAPINLEWGRDNRTTGLRVPVSDAASRRVENRLPGMDCNPYLGIAASLACGYLGLVEGDRPAGPPSPATPMPGMTTSPRASTRAGLFGGRHRHDRRSRPGVLPRLHGGQIAGIQRVPASHLPVGA
jgi:glutamine synthetase